MYTRTIQHVDRPTTTYQIYTKDEADQESIPYRHWQEADQGEWMCTDDGWVAKVITRKEYQEYGRPDRTAAYIYTPVGTVLWHKKYPKTKFRKGSRKNIHKASGKRNAVKEAEINRMLARWYAMSDDLGLAIQMVYGDIKQAKVISIKRMVKTREFKKMLSEEMKELLDQNGLGKADTVTLIQEAFDMARNKQNVQGFIRLVENVIDLNQMKGQNQVKETRMLEETKTQALADVIETEHRLITETLERPQTAEKVTEAVVIDD